MKIKTILKFSKEIIQNPLAITELPKWFFYITKGKGGPLDEEIPWLTFGAIKYLSRKLNKNMVVFEYGSGGSTLFFSKKVKKVISVEHDKNWYYYLKDKIISIENIELNLMESSITGELLNKRNETQNQYFDEYVNQIDRYNNDFDVILIDGRQRNECFRKAIKKIKENGIIVFDNFDREYYKKSLNMIDNNEFQVKKFRGFVPFSKMQSVTAIFEKRPKLKIRI